MIDDVEAFVNVAEVLSERGAYKIYVMATHGVLSADAPRLIEDSHIHEVRCFTLGRTSCFKKKIFTIQQTGLCEMG